MYHSNSATFDVFVYGVMRNPAIMKACVILPDNKKVKTKTAKTTLLGTFFLDGREQSFFLLEL